MSSKKRLGKSLEDISHLFLSGSSASLPANGTKPSERKSEHPVNPRTRVWLTSSLVPGLPSAFFAANLAVESARVGRPVLAIETAPVPSLDEVFGTVPIQPSLNDLLDQPKKQLTLEGPLGMKILSFRLHPEELRAFSSEEREIIFQMLRKEEEAAELVLIHAVYEESPSFERWVRMGQGVILSVDLNAETVRQTYRVCKYLYHVHPGLRIGLIVFGNRDPEDVAAWMKKLTDAVDQFLGKSLEWQGTIQEGPLVERSLAAKIPLTLLDPASKTASGFTAIARHLQPDGGLDPNRPAPIDSFFDRFERTMDWEGGR